MLPKNNRFYRHRCVMNTNTQYCPYSQLGKIPAKSSWYLPSIESYKYLGWSSTLLNTYAWIHYIPVDPDKYFVLGIEYCSLLSTGWDVCSVPVHHSNNHSISTMFKQLYRWSCSECTFTVVMEIILKLFKI